MSLSAPFYLAIGDCVLEDGTGSTDYDVTEASFPEPDPDGIGGHQPAARMLRVNVLGTSASDAADNLNLLRRQAVRDEKLYFRHGSSGDVLECRIREASVIEDAYDPLRRDFASTPYIAVTVSLVTDPYWLAPWSTETTVSSVTALPGHFDISSIGGEVDALVSMRVVPDTNGTALFVGVKPEPGSGYDYVDDYGAAADTSDANAFGGYKLASTGTVDSSLTEHWPYLTGTTVPNIDTNDNRGRHIMLARLDSSATTAGSNTFCKRVTTTGNAISSSVSVPAAADATKYDIAATSNDLTGYELGTVQIPAGQVPDVATGSGYADEAIAVSNTTAASLLTTFGDSTAEFISQSFPVTAGSKHTGVTVKVKNNSASARSLYGALVACSSDVPVPTALYDVLAYVFADVTGSLDGELRLTWTVPYVVPAGTTALAVILAPFDGAAYYTDLDLYYSTATSYANGKTCVGNINVSTIAWGAASAANDIYFKSHTQSPLGFNTTNPVLAACSESSKTLNLDYVCRIPVDYAAIAYRLAASGALGIYYDGDTDNVFGADSDGIGPSVLTSCEVRKPLRVRPGVTNRVVLATLQGDVAPAAMTALKYKTRSRYLTATG